MRNARVLFVSAAFVAAVGIGGSAFTAGNSLPSSAVVKGYGSQTVTGVTAESISYNTNVPGDTITSMGLVLTGDTTAMVIQIAFNDAAPATCSGAGVFAGGTDDTTYSCTVNQAVTTATKFALVAS